MSKENSNVDCLAPKPVHPRAVRFHGLFGSPYVKQHMIIDSRWTPASLTEQFKGMTDLLAKRQVFQKIEFTVNRKNSLREYRNLKRQIRDGRHKLQMCLYGSNTKEIRNFLINHKDMQRLYQKMPIHLVVDNINQRTFVLRKECDRLRYRLNQLKHQYRNQLLERSNLENRLKYENVFVIEEEVKMREFRKKIENSNVRLKAIKSINGTYNKMVHVLRHDSIFYEPILRSLSADIEDQALFIKHVLYLGAPAILKSKELREQYRQVEEKVRKSLQAKIQWMTSFKNKNEKKPSISTTKVKQDETFNSLKRYVRETDSMIILKNELESIETTIKQIKFVTLCSQAKEIFPRMKAQVDNNDKIRKKIEKDELSREVLETKKKRAIILNDVLLNNLNAEEIERMNNIKEMQDEIRSIDESEARISVEIKKRYDVFVLMRVSLWNLCEILRHIDRPPKSGATKYPEAYLQLPLLKYELLTMRVCPPDNYEENIDDLLSLVKRKLSKIMSVYETELSKTDAQKYIEQYHETFINSMDLDDMQEDSDKGGKDAGEDLLQESKTMARVPNRKQIKAQSSKLVEEKSKKDDN